MKCLVSIHEGHKKTRQDNFHISHSNSRSKGFWQSIPTNSSNTFLYHVHTNETETETETETDKMATEPNSISVSLQYERHATILHEPFFSVAVSVLVFVSVNTP